MSLLEDLEELEKSATKGPWESHYETGLNPMVVTLREGSGGQHFGEIICGGDQYQNMGLIAALRNSAPLLIAALRKGEEYLKAEDAFTQSMDKANMATWHPGYGDDVWDDVLKTRESFRASLRDLGVG